MLTQDTERSGLDTLVVGFLREVRTLVRQDMALARHEVQYEISKILKAVLWLGIAALLTLVGFLVIAAVCVLLLVEYTGLPAWVCAALVSVLLLAGACGLVVAGLSVAKSVHVVPLRTIRTLMDDVKWAGEWVHTRFV